MGKRLFFLIIPILVGFILPYYWESINNESLELDGYIITNIAGIIIGMLVYANSYEYKED